MGRTPANKGGTYSSADLNSAAVMFAGLLLQDDELRQTVLDVQQRFARGIKALHKRLRAKFSGKAPILEAETKEQSPFDFGRPRTWLEEEEIGRNWQLARKYESKISEALDALGVRAGWLPRLLLKPPSAGLFGDLAPGPFFNPVQVSGVKRDVFDLDAVLKSSLPDPNPSLDQSSDTGIVSIEFTYDPSEGKRKDIEKSARLQISWQLDQIDEQYQARHGLRPHPRRRSRLGTHVGWLYQRLVEQQTWSEIVEGDDIVNDESSVRDAVEPLAEALRVALPLRKPGPRPKHRTKH